MTCSMNLRNVWATCLGLLLVALGLFGPALGQAPSPPAAQPIPAKPTPRIKSKSHVNIEFRVEPRWARAHIFHGKKLLGKTPLKLKQKRNSGPMDVWVTADGFIPVNTRAHTFKDDKIIIKLTPKEEAHTLFGYKAPLVPEENQPQGGSEAPLADPPAGQLSP